LRRRRALVAGATLLALLLLVGPLALWEERAPRPPINPPPGPFVRSSAHSPATVWAVGDGPDGGPRPARVAQLIGHDGLPDRVLYLGDVYEEPDGEEPVVPGEGGEAKSDDDEADNWSTRFAATFGPLARVTAPVPGNHDWPDEAEAGYLPYWHHVSGHPTPPWYAFSIAGWRVLALNSELDDDEQGAQRAWLRRQLHGPGTCRIAMWHKPVMSAGTHHGDSDAMEGELRALAGHAVLVLNAHEHDMQRFKPRRGLTEFVSGAGGHSLHPIDERDRRLAFSDDADYGALRLELRPGKAAWRFVTTSGRTLDHGTLGCRGA
jgi:hypothetical protein